MAPAIVSNAMEMRIPFNVNNGARSFRAMIQNTETIRLVATSTMTKLSKSAAKTSVNL
jgi:hypothetical protein